MRDLLTTVMEVTGAAVVAAGLGMVYLPLGVIAGGACISVLGWLVGR